MSNSAHEGGLTPPPSHPSRTPSPGPSASYSRQPPPLPPRSSPTPEHASSTSSASPAPPPPLPPRPSEPTISVSVDEGSGSDSDSDSEGEGATEIPPADPGASAASLLSPKEEEALSEVQLRDLYDDEEIDRFLHLFSLYVREVRVAEPVASPRGPSVAQAASASAPAIEEPASPDTRNGGTSSPGTPVWDSSRSLSERIAHDFLLPLLPAPRPPPPEFTLGRLKQTAQRLYVAVEPFYSWDIKPLLKLATWKDPRRSFVYCGLYWTLWYHGLLFSAAVAILLYHLISRKLHPYPSLSELREHRKAIDRSQTFGTILSTRLATSPALGLRDMWDLFGDYKHMRKLKKAKKESAGKKELDAGGPASLDDNASVRSVSFSTPDLGEHQAEAGLLADDEDSADLKRLGLFIMNEAADFLERVKNIFLWRQPGASTYYGVMLLGWFFVGLIPAHYMVRLVGFFAGSIFWHVIPVLAAIPEGEWSRCDPAAAAYGADGHRVCDGAYFAASGAGPACAPEAREEDGPRFVGGECAAGGAEGRELVGGLEQMGREDCVYKGEGRRLEADVPGWAVEAGRQLEGAQPAYSQSRRTAGRIRAAHRDEDLPRPTEEEPRADHADADDALLHSLAVVACDSQHSVGRDNRRQEDHIHQGRRCKLHTDAGGRLEGGEGRRVHVRGLAGRPVRKACKLGRSQVGEGLRHCCTRIHPSLLAALGSLLSRRVLPNKSQSELVCAAVGPSRSSTMFFSPDLLERRDSGYGLLWLAATLGAKSSFKKLPKRSVLTADISELCKLIAEPPEPLALRLSSNLMIGAARVYKVKQEIFFTDVTTCSNALKKAVQDLSAISANAVELQMGQPSMRAEALTLTADPGAAFGLNFDRIFVTWDDRALEDAEQDQEGSDDDFNPRSQKPKSKGKQRQSVPPLSATAEHGRALHTLDEHHNHLLAAAFDGSLTASVQGGPGFAASSSQVEGFGFDDNLFELPEGAGGPDIGDELARELGEGWGAAFDLAQDLTTQGGMGDLGYAPGEGQGLNDDFQFDMPQAGTPENMTGRGSLPPGGSIIVPLAPFSPQSSLHADPAAEKPAQRKGKRVRLLLDSRIELTDQELKMARANYVQEQEALKREVTQKKAEKESSKLIEEMIYGAPRGVQAPVLVDFWLENFRLQVNAHSGQLHMSMEGEPPKKRRKVHDTEPGQEAFSPVRGDDHRMDVDQPLNFGAEYGDFQNMGNDFEFDSRMRSSEEPGQARRGSRPPSAMGSHFDFDLRPTQDIISGSQRSGFFPWDHAGPSSSVGGAAFGVDGSDVFSAMRPASRRGSSLGRDSFLVPGGGTVPPSPINFGLGSSQIGGEDFQFNVPAEETNEESQQSVLTLEKNSFNFLEYAKMQLRANPTANEELAFDDVVPKATSTRRVAAAAFYHCLVLTTKDLLSVRQEEPYGELQIRVK